MGLDWSDKMKDVSDTIETPEHMLGKGLLQPFNGNNSGARKIMFSIHSDHKFPLMGGEKAIIETGYEDKFGDYSSSITRANSDYVVIGKISKFSFAPNHDYWLILLDQKNKRLDTIHRISYHSNTESYGFLYNNNYLDSLMVGNPIPEGTICQKSIAFDDYNNRKDGMNFNVVYYATDDNMEDSIIFSDVAAAKLSSPLIKEVSNMINKNTIPLNLYGDDKIYKAFPDIGETIKNGILLGLRNEKKDDAFFSQSVERLRKPMISDSIKKVHGIVVDVDLYCNNPEILSSHYYAQLEMYYNESKRFASEIVTNLVQYKSKGYEMSYNLQKLFGNAKLVLNNTQYMDKRPFNNIILNITILDEMKMGPGDKASNRYGGKGVISTIWEQKYMPRFKNAYDEYEYVDIIFNQSTMVNRENVGQEYELTLTHIGSEIIKYIIKNKLDLYDSYDLIYKYVSLCSPKQGEKLERFKNESSDEQLAYYIDDIVKSGAIHLSIEPISDPLSIDKIKEIYDTFPFVEMNDVEVAIKSSDGSIRYIPTRRKTIVGKQYIYRLKQYAEEHFSATSLSATNIKNENTKSRASKDNKELFSNTPIRFGNMEINNLNHMGTDAIVTNLMIHSLSPQGRRLVEQMYTGDPFDVDIKLDSDSKNREAEIVNTYLKTIGRRLKFTKIRVKKIKGMTVSPLLKLSNAIDPLIFDKKKKYINIKKINPLIFNNDDKNNIED